LSQPNSSVSSVPAEEQRLLVGAHRDPATWDVDPLLSGNAAIDHRGVFVRTPLLVERQPVPHVEQRLLMHRLVLENREHRLGAMQQWIAASIEVVAFQCRADAAIGFLDKLPHGRT